MKKILIIITAAIMMTALTGCNKVFTRSQESVVRNWQGSKATGDYSFTEKDGKEVYKLVIEEDSTVSFEFKSSAKKGSINISILSSDEKILLEESGEKISIKESLKLPKGNYFIVINYYEAQDGSLKYEISSRSYFDYDNGNLKEKDEKTN